MSSNLRRAAAVGLALLIAFAAQAALPTFWTLENQEDFLSGESDGISIASDGTITLSPATEQIFEATDPFFWSLISDGQGNLYAGSGNDGKVYRIDSSGNGSVVADTNELEVHSLAIDRDRNLYVATSPRGRVYKMRSDGSQQEVFFDPEDRYIWALAFDDAGNLLVATGDKANLYRVKPNGESEVLFASQEIHLVCLTTDVQGNVYAGSYSNGLVYKIERSGKVSVLFDTPFQEVRAVAVDSRGNVYAAAVNGEREASAPPPTTSVPATPTVPPEAAPPIQVPPGTVAESVTVTATAAIAPPTPAETSSGLQGGLYRITAEGAAERLWQSSDDLPLSLKLERDDRVMLGTGKNGRIFLVRQDKTYSLHLRAEADQVTSTASPDERSVFFATSNPARVYRLVAGRRSEGVFRSSIEDTQTVSSWGKIRWEGRVPPGTSLAVQTRTGNSSVPDNTWSDWSASYTVSEGEQISSPNGRFIQWRAVLKSPKGDATPEFLKLTAVYLQQNLRPEVAEITIHPAGQTFQKPLVATGEIEILGADARLENQDGLGPGGGMSMGMGMSPNVSLTAYSRTFHRKGYQTVTWSANDPNEDKMTYDVFYRAEGDTLWRLLRKGLTEAVIAWDTVAMPDGRYTLKIVASDAPSNPEKLALVGEKESRSFDVDNTPPRVLDLQARRDGEGHRLTFRVVDEASAVRRVEYAVDSSPWMVVYPTDGIPDSTREDFDFVVSGFTEGVHTLVVKATDLLGNVGTERIELR